MKDMLEQRFTGRIAGFGTASDTRIVIGMWQQSPFGRFADVMIETLDGHRTLLAPNDEVADYVSSTYTFDEVSVVPVDFTRIDGGLRVVAGALTVALTIGAITPVGRLLRAVPRSLATNRLWLRAINPIATILVSGARTHGSAGGGRTEYYGVTTARAITAVSATWAEAGGSGDLGALAPLQPPVTFGFGSAPANPSLVDVTTIIRSA